MSIVAPVKYCRVALVVLGCCIAIATPATAFLFLLRIRAVFWDYRIVVVLFCVLWLGILGTGWIVPFSIRASNIGPTNYCIDTDIESISSIVVMVNTAYDTLVFFAISWYMFRMTYTEGSCISRLRNLFRGTDNCKISDMLLRSGQLYYL